MSEYHTNMRVGEEGCFEKVTTLKKVERRVISKTNFSPRSAASAGR